MAIDTLKAPPSIGPTLAGSGRILGRVSNDTVMMTRERLRPGRFLGLVGRVFSSRAGF